MHIRIEDSGTLCSHPLSFGFTLNEMKVRTTDKNWEPIFIDRTLKNNQQLPLFKLLQINQMTIYWNPSEGNILSNLVQDEEEQVHKVMREMTKNIPESWYILNPSKHIRYI